MEKLKIALPIIVEGRYDKSALSGFVDATIITTGGFAIFNNREKQSLLRKIAENGVILLTDSDGGGRQIRSFLNGILEKDKIYNLYIPKIEGKERRKRHPSASGTLGVEGMDRELLTRLLSPFALSSDSSTADGKRIITKLDLYEDGLSGGADSSHKRARLCRELDLPDDMTAKALSEALNLLFDYDTYRSAVEKINSNQEK